MKSYSKYQFALFRIVFGTYLIVHFAQVLPWAAALWSDRGILADARLNFTYGVFPNPLWLVDSPFFVYSFVAALLVASVSFTLGYYRRATALFLWFGWACLFHRNNLIANPGLPMVGWLLLASSLVPPGESWTIGKKVKQSEEWEMPKELFWGAWIIVGLSYTISGIDKLMAPSWQDGTAFSHLLTNPLARDYFVTDLMMQLPDSFHKILTWAALVMEIGFGFFCLFGKTRLFAWISILCLHLGILLVIRFADLTFGVLMVHLFTIDPKWFVAKSSQGSVRVVYFDDVCGMCNSAVNALMEMDSARLLRFSPLQGKTAEGQLPEDFRTRMDSIVYANGAVIYTKSTAVLKILRDLGGIWFILSWALVLPRPVRDWFYDFVARNRYRWFGKKESCRLPSAEERALFLD